MQSSKLVYLGILSASCSQLCFAASVNNIAESTLIATKQPESQILASYDGVIGTAPKGKTISAAGVAMEEMQNGAQGYLFFTQTLSNDVYYEIRGYTRYNYMTQNPIFPTIPVSDINNPLGYGLTGFLGYNFHPTELLDITPYLRMNYYRNMNVVYEDNNGNYVNSTALTGMAGAKFSFKVIKGFTPYFNYSAGFQQVSLVGNFNQGANPNSAITATVDQIVSIAEVGLNFKVSQSMSLIPYWQYVTAGNYPDSVAQASYANGGFNVSSLTSTMQTIGFKFSTSW